MSLPHSSNKVSYKEKEKQQIKEENVNKQTKCGKTRLQGT
jgi:hypothetical protein